MTTLSLDFYGPFIHNRSQFCSASVTQMPSSTAIGSSHMTNCFDLTKVKRRPRAVWPTTVLFVLVALVVATLPPLNAAPHPYDHVVIVVEENRTPAQIIGDTVNAPYITSLAN